jgi:hypothetical protein
MWKSDMNAMREKYKLHSKNNTTPMKDNDFVSIEELPIDDINVTTDDKQTQTEPISDKNKEKEPITDGVDNPPISDEQISDEQSEDEPISDEQSEDEQSKDEQISDKNKEKEPITDGVDNPPISDEQLGLGLGWQMQILDYFEERSSDIKQLCKCAILTYLAYVIIISI